MKVSNVPVYTHLELLGENAALLKRVALRVFDRSGKVAPRVTELEEAMDRALDMWHKGDEGSLQFLSDAFIKVFGGRLPLGLVCYVPTN